jgi:anthranilate phosphoribosyltransferase
MARNMAGLWGDVRRVYSREMVMPVIRTMKEIGFKKAMVFHGQSGNGAGGMDEISPVAESSIAELSQEGDIVRYTLLPDEIGLCQRVTAEEISGGDNPRKGAWRLLKVLTGRNKGALYETICINTAPIFYKAGEVQNLKEGGNRARRISIPGVR